ncbi:hypothetical protein [Bacillus sp. C30]|uniref:hypothetical protein n=1 Tax=Bacillus sp. C30 TaxID=1387733 RepID=UPI00349F2249
MNLLEGKKIECISPVCIKRWEFEHEGIPHHDKLYTCMISNEDRKVEVVCEECEIGLDEKLEQN